MKSSVIVSLIIALVIGGLGGWFLGSSSKANTPTQTMTSTSSSQMSTKQSDLKIAMRKLWEDHITWTRLYLVDFATSNGFATADAARLLKNQEDIGNAIKPFYGEDAGNKLTILLKAHITGAVALVTAAKANNASAMNTANADWYNNGNQIADFLAGANPNWPQADLRSMMKSHLDLTKQEAVDILGKKYDASVSDYDSVHDEILQMSDSLSGGIIKQYPDKF